MAVAVLGFGYGEGAKRGDHTGPNPTDRGKSGTKRHTITDRRGAPLACAISSANRHDMKVFGEAMQGIIVPRPSGKTIEQHLCLDKGYDYPEIRRSTLRRGYVPHISERGTGKEPCKAHRRHPPRRWVVERTNGWHNKFRRLLVRYETKSENYRGFLEFANAIICFRLASAS